MHDFEGSLSLLFEYGCMVDVGYACCFVFWGRLTLIVGRGDTCTDVHWMDMCGFFIVYKCLLLNLNPFNI
jgi:hypothetical protein